MNYFFFYLKNLGSGEGKLVNFVAAINQYKPSSATVFAYDWVYLWKSGILTQKLLLPHGVKVIYIYVGILCFESEVFNFLFSNFSFK